ncbi:MAG: urea amidolyase associated protein UAAP2 [Verrucomicrobiales bacterium]
MNYAQAHRLSESPRDPSAAVYDRIVPAGEHWMHPLRAGQSLRIVDVEGNQAADTLFYCVDDFTERYSATDTILAQRNLYLGTGTRLMSSEGRAMLEITADTCGRHDTLGGACSRESNTMRYAHDKHDMHACRDSFLSGLAAWRHGLSKRDVACNINFFMNVPVTPEGGLTFADGISRPGAYVEMRALLDVVCLISNCPQLNNPCNAYNPTPVRVLIWRAGDEAEGNVRQAKDAGEGCGADV